MIPLRASPSLRVRPARPADVAPLARVRVDAWHAAFPGIVPSHRLAKIDLDSSEHMLMAMVSARRRGRRVLALEDADRLAGYCTAGPHRGQLPFRGEIYELYVHPDHQRRGGGRALWSAAVWTLAELGLVPVMLWTPEHGHARPFYESCGGRIVARGMDGSVPLVAYGWPDALPLSLDMLRR